MAKAHTLSDSFTTQNDDRWAGWGEHIYVEDGTVHLRYRGSAQILTSTEDLDLTESNLTIECLYHNTTSGNEGHLRFAPAAASLWSGTQWAIGTSSGSLYSLEMIDGEADTVYVSYNAETMRWWRLRHSGTTIFWETSPNRETWTIRRQKEQGDVPNEGRVKLVGFNYIADEDDQTIFDNLNPSHLAIEAYPGAPEMPKDIHTVGPVFTDSDPGEPTF